MACGGLANSEFHNANSFKKRVGNCTIRLLKVALEMRRFIQPLTYGRDGHKILLKIGIHYGPVIAGVIGHHKPQFSLIGDTINTTSRLCSTGRDGKIILSEKAYYQVKDYEKLLFLERKVDAKGKGELLTYEVKQMRKTQGKSPENKKNSKKSPLKDIKLSLENYQRAMVHKTVKKIRLFEEILTKSESPSELKISGPSPSLLLRKSKSSLINLSNFNIIHKKKDSKMCKISGILDITDQKKNEIMPSLRLSLIKDFKMVHTSSISPKSCFSSRNPTFLISPNSKKPSKIPEPISPISKNSDNFFNYKPYYEDSDEKRLKPKPNSITEVEESDKSPEINDKNDKKSNKSDELSAFIEEMEYEETEPEEFLNKLNNSFETEVEESECDKSPLHYDRNFKENFENSKKYLLNFSRFSLRFTRENDEELIQEFHDILFSDYFEEFNHKKENKYVMNLAIFYFIIEFIILLFFGFPIKYRRIEIIIIKTLNLLGFFIVLQWKNLLYKLNYLKKATCGLFILWVLTTNFSYFPENFFQLTVFNELSQMFLLLVFSHISFINFSETLVFSVFSLCFYLYFSFFSSSKLLFILLSLLLILFSSYKNYLSRLNKFNYSLIKKQKKTQQTDLLMHLLPTHLFKKFMLNPSSKSELIDEFDGVTMLFADIKGFTEFSAKRTPVEVVNMLRDLFTEFDKLCLKNNVYKLYTIGDCYVVLGMINGENREDSNEFIVNEAKNIILMAFSMIETIKLVRKKIGYNGLDMRIGIHTGKIIGGIIGTDIVRYDIYGKDVLIANKMESNGKEGHIMVSRDTKLLLEEAFNDFFLFEYYKDVEIKALGIQVEGHFIYPNAAIL